MVGEVTLGQVSLRAHRFSRASIIQLMPHVHLRFSPLSEGQAGEAW
jgi:hypothetical protein